MDRKDLLLLVGCILVCELAGVVGAVFTTPNIPGWYAGLVKPGFTPPSWVFGPVWTLLYAMMGGSLFLLVKSKGEKKTAYALFAAQLALNTLWSIAFFGMKNPLAGLAIITALWIAIAACIKVFWNIEKKSALLLTPYLAWVSFATALNYINWVLN